MINDKPLNEQLLDELSPWIAKGLIIVHESSDQWWELLRSKYPAAIGQIDWSNVPNLHSNRDVVPHIPPEGIDGSVPVMEHAATIRGFLGEFADRAGIKSDDHIVVLSDGITEDAFEMTFNTLLEVFPFLFSYPQHSYVTPLSADWCFTFMFEFEMYFGSAKWQDGVRKRR